MMPVTEDTLIQALIDDYNSRFRKPGEFSIQEFYERSGCVGTLKTAKAYLDGQAKAGKLHRRDVMEDGHKLVVYRSITPAS